MSSFSMVLSVPQLGQTKWFLLPILTILNSSALLAAFGLFDLAVVTLAIGVSGCILARARVMKQTVPLAEALAGIMCIVEAGALIHWCLRPLSLSSQVSALLSRFASIETQLFYTPADLTPIAMLILLFSYPLFWTAKRFRRTSDIEKGNSTIPRLELQIDGRILLAVAIVLTAFIASYPYLPSINPTGKQVGTDIYYYAQWLGEMEANPGKAIEFAIHHKSSRPLFLLLLYYLRLLLQLPTITFLEKMAVPFFCLLPVSVYCFGTVAKDRTFAGLAALLSSFSINVVAGMYTAYYSNILALSLLYLALTLLLLSLRKMSYFLTLISSALSILTIFIHPWTWAFILVAVCLFAGIRAFRYIRSRGEVLAMLGQLGPVLVFIAANMMADLVKTLLLAVPSGAGLSYGLASARIGLEEFFKLGFNLYFTFRIFAGGYFNNLSVILSAIVGAWWLTWQKGVSRDALLAWLSIGSIPTLFVDFLLNERIFYNLPIQVFSAVGLSFGLAILCSKRILPKTLLLLFILLNLNYAFRSMANLV